MQMSGLQERSSGLPSMWPGKWRLYLFLLILSPWLRRRGWCTAVTRYSGIWLDIYREIFRPASHEARKMESIPVHPNFVTLAEEARLSALLLPDIVPSGLATTTSYSNELQFWYFKLVPSQ